MFHAVKKKRRVASFALLATLLVVIALLCAVVTAQTYKPFYLDTTLPASVDPPGNNCQQVEKPCTSFSKAFQAMLNDSTLINADLRITWSCGLRSIPGFSGLPYDTAACDISDSVIKVFKMSDPNLSQLASPTEIVALRNLAASHVLRMPFNCTGDMNATLENAGKFFGVNIAVHTALFSHPFFMDATYIIVMLDGSSCGDWRYPQNGANIVLAEALIAFVLWTNINPNDDHYTGGSIIKIASNVNPIYGQTRLTFHHCGFVNVAQPLAHAAEANSGQRQLYFQDSIIYNYTVQAFNMDSMDYVYMENSRIEMLPGTPFPVWHQLPAAVVTQTRQSEFRNTLFTGCYSVTCFFIQEFGTVIFYTGIFTDLYPTGSNGYGLLLQSSTASSNAFVRQSNFQRITAQQSPLVLQGFHYTLITDGTTFQDVSCTFYDPLMLETKGGGAILSLDSVRLTITDTQFINTFSSGYGGAILSKSLQPLIMQNSNFLLSTAVRDGGMIMAQYGQVHLTNTRFSNGNATNGGCIAMSHITDTSQPASTFDGCNIGQCIAARSGGCIHLSEALTTVSSNTRLSFCTSNDLGGGIYASQSVVSLVGSTGVYCKTGDKGGFVHAQDFAIISIDQGSFIGYAQAANGGVASMTGSGLFSLSNSEVQFATALFNGATILVDSPKATVPFVGIDFDVMDSVANNKSNIANLKAMYGDIRGLKFKNLHVVEAHVGISGEFMHCQERACINPADMVAKGIFTVNMEWATGSSKPVSPAANVYSGSEISKLELVSIKANRMDDSNSQITLKPGADGYYLLYPNQEFFVTVVASDAFGGNAAYDPNTVGRLETFQTQEELVSSTVTIVPPVVARLQRNDGILDFTNVHLQGPSGATLSLNVSVTQSTGAVIQILLPVRLGKCPVGYQEILFRCILCLGSYSRKILAPGDQCQTCPAHASCMGSTITAIDGYQVIYLNDTVLPDPQLSMATGADIRSFLDVNQVPPVPLPDPPVVDNSSLSAGPADEVVQCPSSSSCLSGNKCSNNRAGYLCGQCAEGTSEWSGKCVKCDPQDPTNGGFLVLYLLYMAVIFLVTHNSAQSQASASMKILSFFTQTYLLTVGPYSDLFNWARAIFAFNIYFPSSSDGGDPSSGSSSSDIVRCPFPRDSYGRLITDLIQPIVFLAVLVILAALALVVKAIITIIKRISQRGAKPVTRIGTENQSAVIDEQLNEVINEAAETGKQTKLETVAKKVDVKKILRLIGLRVFNLFFDFKSWVRSFVQLLILSYTMFSNAGLSYFACAAYAGRPAVVLAATDITCYTPEYYARGVPFILALIYCFGLPILFAALLLVFRVTNKLQHQRVKDYFGNLYLNYQDRYFFYEGYAMIRRLAVAFIVAFISDALTRTLVLLPIFSFFLLVQMLLRPYKQSTENVAEEIQLIGLILMVSLRGQSGFETSYSAQSVLLAIFIVVVLVIILSYLANFWLVRLIYEKIKTAMRSKMPKKVHKPSKEAELKKVEAEFLQSETPQPTPFTPVLSPTSDAPLISSSPSTPNESVVSPSDNEIELKPIDPNNTI